MAEGKESPKSEAISREEKILEFWKKNNTFEKTLAKPSPKGEYIFYEGPPTANGRPHIGHFEARAFKDAVLRYKTMRGYHARRKGGWDTHGLPVELGVEKKLGLNSKKAIEEYGIAKFNEQCKRSVWEYMDLWEKFTERIGYWVDQKNPYVTYHNDYIESLWNIVKKVDEQGLLYKDYKVVPWCPRCGTVLSSHELAQGYEDVKDLSVYVKFRVKFSPDAFVKVLLKSATRQISTPRPPFGTDERRARPDHSQNHSGENFTYYILAWTTTPWTLPGNVALAVGENVDYVKVKKNNEIFFLAKERISILDGEYEILEELKGKDLVGLEYEPLYPYLKKNISESERPKLKGAYKVYPADFVTTQDGTGVVHTAVMYGQDDFVLGTKIGLPKHHLVGLDGKFLPGTDFLEGKFVRDEETAVEIIKDLARRSLLLKKEKYEHPYPFCWRCHTALIYYARDSWYIKVSDPKVKDKMISENQKINWEPAHIRDGRFGEWLGDIKDWAISRERYWGTPLPVWICAKCGKREIIGSVEELKRRTKKSGNSYFLMRHGQAESNLKDMIACRVEDKDNLTDLGRQQVLDSAERLKEKNIDLIFSSDIFRAKETAEITGNELKIENGIIFDKRLREWNVGNFDGKTWKECKSFVRKHDWYNYVPEGGESFKNVKTRSLDFIYELENKFRNKNILVVTHQAPIVALLAGLENLSDKDVKMRDGDKNTRLKGAEFVNVRFSVLPHNEDYELDLHRPYIDEIPLACECGGELKRVKEVIDVWFDSGAMPFAEDHYPFENKDWIDGPGYPADFISEAIDQTRGWFYTLHAVGALMGRGRAYKNVICLGHLLDAEGKKMSKHIGNVVDPWEMIEKYGADTLRLWMYSVNQPGESKNFDEKTVILLHRQVFGLLYNVLSFYELYRDESLSSSLRRLADSEKKGFHSEALNILDKWILSRLTELQILCTENLDKYKLLEPVRAIRDFIDDLSTWYLRRSRERIKNGDANAKRTLYFVLKNLAKLLAPFAPFAAEDIWQKLRSGLPAGEEESVHLSEWPYKDQSLWQKLFGKKEKVDYAVLENMRKTREIVTLGLEARQKAGIRVRQPLGKLEIKSNFLSAEYLDLIKDEMNVKEIVKNNDLKNEILLHTEITPELKAEGDYRELARAIQDLRKEIGLVPSDSVTLVLGTDAKGEELTSKFKNDLLKTVSARKLELKENDGKEIKIGESVFRIKIKK